MDDKELAALYSGSSQEPDLDWSTLLGGAGTVSMAEMYKELVGRYPEIFTDPKARKTLSKTIQATDPLSRELLGGFGIGRTPDSFTMSEAYGSTYYPSPEHIKSAKEDLRDLSKIPAESRAPRWLEKTKFANTLKGSEAFVNIDVPIHKQYHEGSALLNQLMDTIRHEQLHLTTKYLEPYHNLPRPAQEAFIQRYTKTQGPQGPVPRVLNKQDQKLYDQLMDLAAEKYVVPSDPRTASTASKAWFGPVGRDLQTMKKVRTGTETASPAVGKAVAKALLALATKGKVRLK